MTEPAGRPQSDDRDLFLNPERSARLVTQVHRVRARALWYVPGVKRMLSIAGNASIC